MDPNIGLENEHCEDKAGDKKIYLSLVGSLMYAAALGTHPDIAYAVTILSQYNAVPLTMHYTAAIKVFRYLKSTANFKLHYEKSDQNHLRGFTNTDWAGCIFYGLAAGAIAWQAKTQPVVALSTLEAEYIAASDATREAIWLKRLSTELTQLQEKAIDNAAKMGCDNQGALNLIKTGVIKAKTKHICQVSSYLLTKPLVTSKHQELTTLTGLW